MDFFLKSLRPESRSSCQIASDNPQKNIFHNIIFLEFPEFLSEVKTELEIIEVLGFDSL